MLRSRSQSCQNFHVKFYVKVFKDLIASKPNDGFNLYLLSWYILVQRFYQHHQHPWSWPWVWGHRLRILKMLKFLFKFLIPQRPYNFLTLPPIWLIFGEMIHTCPRFCAVQPPFPPSPPPPHLSRGQNQGHWQKLQYQASYPVWPQVLLFYKSPRCFLPSFFQFSRSEKKIFKIVALVTSWISDQNNFSYVWSTCTSHPDASYLVSSQLAFLFRRRSEQRFQDGPLGGHLGFPVGMILTILDLQVTPMLSTKFQINWHFGPGEEAKNKFSRWWPFWISDQNDFSCFWSTSHFNGSYKFQVNWPFGSGEEAKNRFSKWP